LDQHEQVRAGLALQLNFLQDVFTILKQHGRAAIVVPDNVIFREWKKRPFQPSRGSFTLSRVVSISVTISLSRVHCVRRRILNDRM
jgi:hypothetical protein